MPRFSHISETVLVIEYGQIEYAPGIFDPPATVWAGAQPGLASTWLFSSLPNPEVKNKPALVFAGKAVGGSSTSNGMFFDRGSRFDYDAWADVGSPEFDSHHDKWSWKDIFPYFKKSVTFAEPPASVVHKYGYTWDLAAFGGTTPIYSSFPPFLWGDHSLMRNAWEELGVPVLKECAGGDKAGLCWIPISEHPITARRSHAGLGHYADVNETRPNYDLLVRHQVIRVAYPHDLKRGPPMVEVRSLADNRIFNVTAKAEVILSAGAFHTPTVLHRSGIGPASVIREAGIPLVLDLPGVGNNFQDHSGPSITWNYTTPLNVTDPLPIAMLNATFAAEALEGFKSIPARGPYTLSQSNSALYLSLLTMAGANATKTILHKIRTLISSGTASSFLPQSYRSDPTMIAGYEAQLSTLARKIYSRCSAPSIEVPWATGTAARLFLLHPLSRGTVRLNSTHPLEQPILDYRTGSNPIDFDIHLAHVRYLRRIFTTPTMITAQANELALGEAIASDDAALLNYVKDTMTFSFMHPCCTAAMLPLNKGGVVGPDLKVFGAEGLRVVDMSILPLLPSSHLSATAYAVGEKAADIIIRAWS
ncbi:GMC oxidoreductase-like protein [Podospora didyma]|uniref:GMC oxidoreductase-like protein n=1 Tax=Podospora didyma TaxID=330526 RepID=A0AAE0NXP8_9PEZI|nr:GMC oxidoreductase-like protein [Podospora didyma]